MKNQRIFDSGAGKPSGGHSGGHCDVPCSDKANTTCELCGQPMHCGKIAGTDGCWCAQLAQMIPIAGKPNARCLCPKCLMEQIRSAFDGKEAT